MPVNYTYWEESAMISTEIELREDCLTTAHSLTSHILWAVFLSLVALAPALARSRPN
jgi:hypothetical protein